MLRAFRSSFRGRRTHFPQFSLLFLPNTGACAVCQPRLDGGPISSQGGRPLECPGSEDSSQLLADASLPPRACTDFHQPDVLAEHGPTHAHSRRSSSPLRAARHSWLPPGRGQELSGKLVCVGCMALTRTHRENQTELGAEIPAVAGAQPARG